MYYVYILECNDGTLYTGWTVHMEKRLEKHNTGTGAKYTRGRHPVVLKYLETYTSKTAALQREYEIKRLPRADKVTLIAQPSG